MFTVQVERELGWRDLQAVIVRRCALSTAFVGWGAWFALMSAFSYQLDLALALILLTIAGVVIWLQANARPQLMAAGLVATLFLAFVIFYIYFGLAVAGYLFCLPVLLAGFLLHPAAGLPVTAAAWAALYCGSLISIAPQLTPVQDGLLAPVIGLTCWRGPAVVVGLVALFQTIGLSSLYAELRSVWRYSAAQSTAAEEARTQRGEVQRLNKALNLAYDLLQRSNNELAAARWEAEQSRHLKEQFATHISHQLRTPLNIILGFMEIMQRYPEVYGDVSWTPKLRRDLGEIQSSARYLSDLVDDILDLARIEALRMPIRREMTDLEKLLHEVRDLAAQLVRDKPTQMRVELREPLPELYIDRTRIRQVLLNLLANASRFTAQGEIVVRARVEGDEVVVAVSDTGVGIPKEQLGTLFAEFRQVESGGQAPSTGKGLGLAIARRFVEMHGGHIWAESEPGRGSTFAFSLPIQARPLGELIHPLPLALPGTPHQHSLVVIDAEEGATYLRRHLDGIEIIAASDPDSGRRLVAERHPDALLVNVAPGAEGIHQPHPASRLPWDVPLLRCSLPVNAWLVDHDLFDDWLSKPVTGERLLETIARFSSEGQILIVDDEIGFVSWVRRILEASGAPYTARQVHSGQEAVLAATTNPPDLILLDIILPDQDGRAIAHTLRRNTTTQRVPIVAVSGTPPGALRAPAPAQGFSIIHHAGFREEELLGLIRATLQIVKPRYGDEAPVQAPAEAPGATQAS